MAEPPRRREVQVLREAELAAGDRGVEICVELVSEHAPEAVLCYVCPAGHDLIGLGYQRHFLGDITSGAVAERVVHHALCPVIVVR